MVRLYILTAFYKLYAPIYLWLKSWCSFWEQVLVLILGARVCAHLGARVGAHFGSKSCLILMADNNKLALIQTE